MQSNRPQAVAGPRAADLHLRLEQLIAELDESSLRATLTLMLAETRDAIRKKQSLIALERLDGRDTADRIARLRELESLQNELMATYTRHVPPEDDVTVDGNERGAAICTATPALARAFKSQEREGYVGRHSAVALQGEPSRPQPPAARAR